MRTNIITAISSAVILAATLGSCQNDEVMGGDIMPTTDMAAIHVTDTIEIKAYTELEDTVFSSNQTYLLLGDYDDPIFGKTSASFGVKFSNTSYGKYTDGAMCDSVILTIGCDTVGTRFYGDSTKTVTVNVYAMTKQIYYDSSYYSNFNMDGYFDENPIATVSYSSESIDSMLTISLDKEYGDKIIAATADTTFDENICGLYFKVADGNTGNSIIKFKSTSSFTEYKVYYHAEGDTASSSVTYSVSTDDPSVSMITHDYSGTKFYDQLQNPRTIQDTSLYLQALVGTRIKLEFPDVKKFNDVPGKYYTILHAQLYMPLADSVVSDEAEYPAIEDIVCMGRYDETGYIKYFYEFLTSSSSSTTSYTVNSYPYLTDTHEYQLNMTWRVKELIDTYTLGNEPDYSILVYPNGRIDDFHRSVINSPTHTTNPMKMIVEYLTYEK